jgi:hypothetical protein
MFELIQRFQELMATCTASATPGAPSSLVGAVCYDSKGCCAEEAPLTSAAVLEAKQNAYQQCVTAAGSPEEKLGCISKEVTMSG